ncbi:hypothetical protein YDYSG_27350 [Paenibacillus tyrfis]|uniref:lamin tail domain-containing protein n=1 Tax=Paenibacillus tyrfis TaxID=1501230 RepID=UPI0024900CF7|nr:lamin tail domain-containing protein [Paenibacillus tyrfis]GLI06705.1 hypothetical protein YDYSG_27350 [Paenibacillus tyrfis]
MKNRKIAMSMLNRFIIASMVLFPMQYVQASAHAVGTYSRVPDGTGEFIDQEPTKGKLNIVEKEELPQHRVIINEINSSPDDWVEFINLGTGEIDLSGYEIRDNSDDHRWKFAEGTKLPAGELFVVDANTDGQVYDDQTDAYVAGKFAAAIGIGSGDSIRLYDKAGKLLDEYSWTEHASYKGDEALASFGRYPDGTGEFMEFPTSTKGKANIITNPVILNEIQSNDLKGGYDWIELANPTGKVLDISGIVIKDSDDTHQYVIPKGTTIPKNGFLVLTEKMLGFGLGKNDSVRLFEKERLIASTTWKDHTNPTWGLYPDLTGTEYRNTKEATPNERNKFKDVPVVEWPGNGKVVIFDHKPTFLKDSSGLDFFKGQLYAVDNGTGKFWVLDVSKNGELSFAKGFEKGKRVRFQKDAHDVKAAGPDAEGITVDGDGFVYIASERDNNVKDVNFNMILKVDPHKEGNDLVALQQWDLTASLPQVSANMGIEAVEWVSNANVVGKLYDQNTDKVFDATKYPNAISNGVFFVALEDNGHVYAYVLNKDGSSVQIADIDGKIGGAMALDYDTYEKVLWAVADDGYNNRAAKISINGKKNPDIVHVLPPSGVDISSNNEGFAIAEASFTKDGQRPVYRFKDGEKSGSLSIGSIASDYKEGVVDNPGNGGSNNGTVNPTPITPTPGTPKVDQNRINVTSVLTQTSKGSIATAALTEQALAEAIAFVEENPTETTVKIKVEAAANAKTVEMMIPNKSIRALAEARVETLVIESPIATITFDAITLKTIAEAAKADVKISASVVDSGTLSVSGVTKERIADRPIFDFTVTSGDAERSVISKAG